MFQNVFFTFWTGASAVSDFGLGCCLCRCPWHHWCHGCRSGSEQIPATGKSCEKQRWFVREDIVLKLRRDFEQQETRKFPLLLSNSFQTKTVFRFGPNFSTCLTCICPSNCTAVPCLFLSVSLFASDKLICFFRPQLCAALHFRHFRPLADCPAGCHHTQCG